MKQRGRPRRGDLSGFPGEVAQALDRLINQHDVPYRVQDGRHVLLFSGRREPPLKVSAARAPTNSMRYINRWARRHVKGWE